MSARPFQPSLQSFPWTVPEALDLSFRGFSAEAFDVLESLRWSPHIEQYRAVKDVLGRAVQAPFRAYRDDLVVNWIIPNRLDFETERNVFSRFLKNDFGAGGCHDRLWMSFYRTQTTRLRDLQLVHAIDPDGFAVSLFAGANAPAVLRTARAWIESESHTFQQLVGVLLETGAWRFYLSENSGGAPSELTTMTAADVLRVTSARAFWVRTKQARPEVEALGAELVAWSLASIEALWPLYVFLLSGADPAPSDD